jgi:enoyl-CoA hydratase
MSEVRFEVKEGVALITLDAPDRHNAFVPRMVDEFVEACDAADNDPAVGAVIVRGAGKSFCSGAHRGILNDLSRDPASGSSYATLGGLYRPFARFGEVLSPTIAAVRGNVIGAGLNLMLAADLRIIATDARVVGGFGRIGLHPGGGHFALLGRTANREVAAAMGLFGEQISGERAALLNLAWVALPPDEVDARAFDLARVVSRDPELARAAAKSFRLELGPPSLSWAAAIELEMGVQMWSLRRRNPTSPPS